jgi:hypothetical protein
MPLRGSQLAPRTRERNSPQQPPPGAPTGRFVPLARLLLTGQPRSRVLLPGTPAPPPHKTSNAQQCRRRKGLMRQWVAVTERWSCASPVSARLGRACNAVPPSTSAAAPWRPRRGSGYPSAKDVKLGVEAPVKRSNCPPVSDLGSGSGCPARTRRNPGG